jgi:hypothetical protein
MNALVRKFLADEEHVFATLVNGLVGVMLLLGLVVAPSAMYL